MVHYKLIYFNARGRAEPIRHLFAVAHKPFEDFRLPRSNEQWLQYKGKTPFGALPILEVDSHQLGQSFAIIRYLAHEFGFAGKCDWSQAQVDAYADQWKDFQNEITPFLAVVKGLREGDLEKLKEEVFLPGVAKHLPFFADALKKNDSGFLVGSSLTYVDLIIADMIENFEKNFPQILEPYPSLRTHRMKIHSIPEIKKWIETRPQTPM